MSTSLIDQKPTVQRAGKGGMARQSNSAAEAPQPESVGLTRQLDPFSLLLDITHGSGHGDAKESEGHEELHVVV